MSPSNKLGKTKTSILRLHGILLRQRIRSWLTFGLQNGDVEKNDQTRVRAYCSEGFSTPPEGFDEEIKLCRHTYFCRNERKPADNADTIKQILLRCVHLIFCGHRRRQFELLIRFEACLLLNIAYCE